MGALFLASDQTIRINTADTERMRIDSSGNVGIGMSPTGKLSIRPSGTGSEDTHFGFGANLDAYITTGSSGNVIFREGNGAGANTERMRIDASGNVLVGTTNTDPIAANENGSALLSNGRYKIHSISGFDPVVIGTNTVNTGVAFYYHNGTSANLKGSIDIGSGSVAYNTTSDQRLKENIADADDAGSKIDAIQVTTSMTGRLTALTKTTE